MKLQLLLVFGLVLLTACTVPIEKQCTTNDECVAATCCHAIDSVNSEFAPECSDTLCTAQCEPQTLDCGAGETTCVHGACQVVLN